MSLLVSLIKHHAGDLSKVFSSNTQRSQSAWVARVPLDIIVEIAERLTNLEDILSLSLTVRRF
jgi:flagellar motor switch protein FliM